MELKQELKKVKELEYKSKSDPLAEYASTFVQRIPRYTVKLKENKHWRTKKKFLVDTPIKAHLLKKYCIGVLGKWYPEYSILDIDNVTLEEPERIRDKLGLDPANSMLCSSESPDSYHILIRPSYNNKPPTIRLLQNTFKLFVKQNNIEIYPQANRTIRLPFGYNQDCLDIGYIYLKSWEEKLYWFLKLDDFDLSDIPYQQRELDLTYENPGIPDVFKEGEYLLKNGLQIKNSRHDAQFKMLYNLWRRNIPVSQAKIIVWFVIKNRHNGFSKTIITNPGECKKEIDRQAARIYDTYEHSYIYPDETHNINNGYITKKDIADIVRINTNLPRMRFLYNFVKYCYPRRDRNFINIHSDKLIEWSSTENYIKYLDELNKLEIVKRGNKYVKNGFSKSININWNFRNSKEAILDDGRSPNTFEDTIKLSHKPEEFKALLKKAGIKRTTAIETVRRIF
ncbi:hypothetical protein ES702_05469 [subsurface metagenome]